MYYIIENWKITWSSENYLSSKNWITIEKEFTSEELEKIQAWYSYNIETELFEASPEVLEQEKQNKISEIKQKYQDIIFAKYSLTDQLNMWNEATYITSMVAFEKRDFTADEIVRLNEIKEAKIWIDEQRKLCSQEISNL